MARAPDDDSADFVIEVDEELDRVPSTTDDDPEAAAIASITAGHAIQQESTRSFAPRELLDRQLDPSMLVDIQRAKDAGVSLVSARIEALPDDLNATLEISDGRSIPIGKSVLIVGRGKDVADVHLATEEASRQHAAIIYARGDFFIEDLGSTNGTFIRGKRIKRVRMSPGLVVSIGELELHIEMDLPIASDD